MKHKQKNAIIKTCALLYRYVFPLAICIVPFLISKLFYENTRYGFCLWFGIMSILFATYSLIGYLCKWKHIFCAFQNSSHQKMTPDHINWSKVEKSDAYGIPAIFFCVRAYVCCCVIFEYMNNRIKRARIELFSGLYAALSRTMYPFAMTFLFQSEHLLSLTPSLLLFVKSHAWLTCSVVNVLATVHCRYQLFAGSSPHQNFAAASFFATC